MPSSPNTYYGNKPINEAIESLNAQQLERETNAVAPFANVHVELTRAVSDADLRIHSGNKQKGGDNTFDGIDGAYDLMRLAENAMQEARHEPRQLKPHEVVFIEHMQVVADAYKKYAQLDPSIRETLGTPNSPNVQYSRSNDLEGNEAHDYIIQAEYAATHPYDTDAVQAANEADQLLDSATGYYQYINRFYRELLDEADGEIRALELESTTEQELARPRAKEQIAKEAIKAVSKEASAEATEAIVSNGDSDIDKDDLFAAIQHDFKDFIPSAEMQANEDFGGILTERGRELLAKDRQGDNASEVDNADSETTSEGQKWFDAMNESFNPADIDKSVEVLGETRVNDSQDNEIIEALREMGQLDEAGDPPSAENIEQIDAVQQEESVEIVDEMPESLEQAKLDKRRKKAAKALGKLTKSVMFSVDKKELRRATKKMKKLSRRLDK